MSISFGRVKGAFRPVAGASQLHNPAMRRESTSDKSMMSNAKSIAHQRGENDSLSEEYVFRRMEQKQRMAVNKFGHTKNSQKNLQKFYSNMGGVYNAKQMEKMYGIYQESEEKKMYKTEKPFKFKKGDLICQNALGEIGELQNIQMRGDMVIMEFMDRSITVDALDLGWSKLVVQDDAVMSSPGSTPHAASSATGNALFKEDFGGKAKKTTEIEKGKEAEKEHIGTFKKLYDHDVTPAEAPLEVAKDHLKENENYYEKWNPKSNKEFLVSQDEDDEDETKDLYEEEEEEDEFAEAEQKPGMKYELAPQPKAFSNTYKTPINNPSASTAKDIVPNKPQSPNVPKQGNTLDPATHNRLPLTPSLHEAIHSLASKQGHPKGTKTFLTRHGKDGGRDMIHTGITNYDPDEPTKQVLMRAKTNPNHTFTSTTPRLKTTNDTEMPGNFSGDKLRGSTSDKHSFSHEGHDYTVHFNPPGSTEKAIHQASPFVEKNNISSHEERLAQHHSKRVEMENLIKEKDTPARQRELKIHIQRIDDYESGMNIEKEGHKDNSWDQRHNEPVKAESPIAHTDAISKELNVKQSPGYNAPTTDHLTKYIQGVGLTTKNDRESKIKNYDYREGQGNISHTSSVNIKAKMNPENGERVYPSSESSGGKDYTNTNTDFVKHLFKTNPKVRVTSAGISHNVIHDSGDVDFVDLPEAIGKHKRETGHLPETVSIRPSEVTSGRTGKEKQDGYMKKLGRGKIENQFDSVRNTKSSDPLGEYPANEEANLSGKKATAIHSRGRAGAKERNPQGQAGMYYYIKGVTRLSPKDQHVKSTSGTGNSTTSEKYHTLKTEGSGYDLPVTTKKDSSGNKTEKTSEEKTLFTAARKPLVKKAYDKLDPLGPPPEMAIKSGTKPEVKNAINERRSNMRSEHEKTRKREGSSDTYEVENKVKTIPTTPQDSAKEQQLMKRLSEEAKVREDEVKQKAEFKKLGLKD